MKKLILGLVALLSAGVAMAGSIDYLSNQSADYLRTFSRNASLDADAAVYNPAGTAFLAPGLTLGLSNQTIFKLYENDLSVPGVPSALNVNQNYKSTLPTYFLPNGEAIWNGGPWAAYLASGIVAGGGTAQYDNGVPTIAFNAVPTPSTTTPVSFSGNLTATSLYPQVTLGGAYAVLDSLSFSVAVRYVYSYKSFSGSATYTPLNPALAAYAATYKLDATQTAQGFGGIFGVDWKAWEGLLLTARFETATALPFTTKVNNGNDLHGAFKDGATSNRDLPALAALGARYDWNAFSFTASETCYILGPSVGTGYASGYNYFGWETGASAEYAFIPEVLKASVGGLISNVGGNASTYNDFDFSLDSQSIGGGVVWTALKDLDLTLALSKTFYTSASGNQASTKYTTYIKDAFTIDLGVQYKLF